MASTSSRPSVLQRAAGSPSSDRNRTVAYAATVALVGLAAMAFGMWLGGNLSQRKVNALLIGGTNSLTGWGLPASKLVLEISSVGVVGMLTACLLLTTRDRELSPPARRCLRSAGWLALAWAVSNVALLLFSWSDTLARPVTALPIRTLFTDPAATFPDAPDYFSSIVLTVVISAGIFITQTRWGALILLPLTLYDLVPMTLQGHAAHSTVLKYSLGVHIIAMSLWAGGLAALLAHVRREPNALAIAVPRFSTLALYCYTAVAASGLLAAWQLLQTVPAIWGSRYGGLVMFKTAALIALGILGWWHRRHTVNHIRTGDRQRSRRAFIQLAAAEVIVMVAAVGLAVALSRSASPDTINLHGGRQAASFAPLQPAS